MIWLLGKIASHGPYKTVADIYNIPGLTEHDKCKNLIILK